MKRKAFSVAVAALVWAVGIGAHNSHFHHGNSGHAHPTNFTHMHLGHAPAHELDAGSGAALDLADDDATAVWQDWSGILVGKVLEHNAILADRVVLGPEVSEHRFAVLFVLGTHDPPDLSNSSSRAPPV